ncbi:MAG TPA: dTDP-4-amino-4,6-dideoxygalactose transaminase, partial [Kofleriaceae bacterium]|nr:dTDP-4-amino-4,6-dideoxygalactose transaminase [Kofleriaceae bacterium]
YIKTAIDSMHVSGNGPFTKRCERFLEDALGVPKVLLTTSCTHALEMAALLLDLEPGDEVIVPSFTFVSTVNAYALRGARIVFADIRPDTLNLDETRLEALVTPRTKAIVPVHYGGVGCEMDAIRAIAARANAVVIEDNAHGLFGRYRGKALGTFGALATQSFHDTKNIACGEGGALVINDPRFVERAEIVREKGTNRSRFFRGQVDKYTWVDIGSSYVVSDILAALLLSQLELRDQTQAHRARVWNRYANELTGWAADRGVALPTIPAHCEQPFHVFYMLVPADRRAAFIDHMKSRGVQTVFHYQALNTSPMGLAHGGKSGQCPVTERVADELVRLPLYNDLSDTDQSVVIDAVRAF